MAKYTEAEVPFITYVVHRLNHFQINYADAAAVAVDLAAAVVVVVVVVAITSKNLIIVNQMMNSDLDS